MLEKGVPDFIVNPPSDTVMTKFVSYICIVILKEFHTLCVLLWISKAPCSERHRKWPVAALVFEPWVAELHVTRSPESGTLTTRPSRLRHIPFPDSLGQVKLPVCEVDLSKVSLYILYKQNIKKCLILEVGQIKSLGYLKPCIWVDMLSESSNSDITTRKLYIRNIYT